MPNDNLKSQLDKILSLEDDWNDEGAISYKRETAEKTLKYIEKMYETIPPNIRDILGEPIIGPGCDGSIDVHWKNDKYELLMSVPPGDKSVMYYGDNRKEELVIEGELSLDE